LRLARFFQTGRRKFSLTQVLDRPLSGRIFFEEVIRENLDLGRPDKVQLIFDRRVTKRTPGRFRTRVLTNGVTPSLHVDYKHTGIKQYHKEGRALRTETTINNPRDFGIGKRSAEAASFLPRSGGGCKRPYGHFTRSLAYPVSVFPYEVLAMMLATLV
jgi:hypothetical protein